MLRNQTFSTLVSTCLALSQIRHPEPKDDHYLLRNVMHE
jgi:hypothetical protein